MAALAALLVLAACAPVQDTPPPPPPPPPTSTPVPLTVDLDEAGVTVVGSPPASESGELFVVTFDAAEVVDRVMPAVVTVINEQQFSSGFPGRQTEVEVGSGTGFIIDDAGHIVTNEHVVREGTGFEVILANGENRSAELVGADPLSDLAVVQMEGPVPASVAFGDSNTLQQGQPVLAIGSPLGNFTGTVTSGIVSALNRDFPDSPAGSGEGVYTDLIQHDAAINPGNSGGPLFDLAGRVIGVNTLGIPQSGMTPVQGLFFAIPANHVARIVDELIANGEVAYPRIGIRYQPISPDLAAQNDLPIDYGAYVVESEPGGPAANAGIRTGDIITAIGDQRISGNTTFPEALFARAAGETVPVTVLRNGQEQEFEVTLGRR
jgi:2-alkenal reductase